MAELGLAKRREVRNTARNAVDLAENGICVLRVESYA